MSSKDRDKSEMETSQPTTVETQEKPVITTEPSSTKMRHAQDPTTVAGQQNGVRGAQIER